MGHTSKQEILRYLKTHGKDMTVVDNIIINSFLDLNNLNVKNNSVLKKIVQDKKSRNLAAEFSAIYLTYKKHMGFEDLIELFEIVVPEEDKVSNGAVYTPNNIKDFIVKQTLQRTKVDPKKLTICDMACGCGGFLYTAAKELKRRTNRSFKDIFAENIFGVDVSDYCTKRTQYLLCLLAISEKEDAEFRFNLFCANSLEFRWLKIQRIKDNGGFDIIVGNPPYVRSRNIDAKSAKLLKKLETSKIGNADLYIPFFEIGLRDLNAKGTLGYITVNTFTRSLNAKLLREYLSSHNVDLEIIDFGAHQVFEGKMTYTCICFMSHKKSAVIKYVRSSPSDLNTKREYTEIPYKSLTSDKWLLNTKETAKIIAKIENCGSALGSKYIIRNGIATLANSTYIFTPESSDAKSFHLTINGTRHHIEKAICRNIVKPNILKSETELVAKTEKVILPYREETASQNGVKRIKLKLVPEQEFRKKYPGAYKYLNSFRSELSKRDKGEREYEEWYAFGRTQGLLIKGKKIFFPYIANAPRFVMSEDPDLLFYCGYAIFVDSSEELHILKKVLDSDVFWYYIQNTSKPYTEKYFSTAKNHVKNFGIPNFSKSERDQILRINNSKELNAFLWKKYLSDNVREAGQLKLKKFIQNTQI